MKGMALRPMRSQGSGTALNRVTTACAQPMRLHTTLGARASMLCYTTGEMQQMKTTEHTIGSFSSFVKGS